MATPSIELPEDALARQLDEYNSQIDSAQDYLDTFEDGIMERWDSIKEQYDELDQYLLGLVDVPLPVFEMLATFTAQGEILIAAGEYKRTRAWVDAWINKVDSKIKRTFGDLRTTLNDHRLSRDKIQNKLNAVIQDKLEKKQVDDKKELDEKIDSPTRFQTMLAEGLKQ